MAITTQWDLTSVIIVACNSGGLLIENLSRVLCSSAAIEVIVSDNASDDGSIEHIGQRWANDSRVRVLRNRQNLGFGVACNRAAAEACGDMLVFLNPDCLLEPDSIRRLRERLFADPQIGLAGADIVDAHGRSEPAARRRDPTLRRSLMTISGLQRLSSRWPAFAGVGLPASPGVPVQPVDAVSGALMALPRGLFDRLGGFDENYFLHCEDLDLCRRVRDLGHRVVCVNDVRVVHLKGSSSRQRPFLVAWHKHRGMLRWFKKFDPAARSPLTRGVVQFGLCLHFLVLAPAYAWRALRLNGNG